MGSNEPGWKREKFRLSVGIGKCPASQDVLTVCDHIFENEWITFLTEIVRTRNYWSSASHLNIKIWKNPKNVDYSKYQSRYDYELRDTHSLESCQLLINTDWNITKFHFDTADLWYCCERNSDWSWNIYRKEKINWLISNLWFKEFWVQDLDNLNKYFKDYYIFKFVIGEFL